jgi:hypothetical protein
MGKARSAFGKKCEFFRFPLAEIEPSICAFGAGQAALIDCPVAAGALYAFFGILR